MSSIEGSDSDDNQQLEIDEIQEPDIVLTLETPGEPTLLEKSRHKYSTTYDRFMKWKDEKDIKMITEELLIEYFMEISSSIKPSSLYARYSMLKTMIKLKDNVDIGEFKGLKPFLKERSTGFISQKAAVFTAHEIEKFLNEAPDYKYLVQKVSLCFGVSGSLKRDELCYLTTDDIEDDGTMLLIRVMKPGATTWKSFTVENSEFYAIYKRYVALRPQNIRTNRFFLQCKKGACTHQVIGVNKFGAMPRQIALYLNLKNPDVFTGHSFKRTATSLNNEGGYMSILNKSKIKPTSRLAQRVMEESICLKRQISQLLTGSIVLKPTFPTIVPSNNNNVNVQNNDAGTSKNNNQPVVIKSNSGPISSVQVLPQNNQKPINIIRQLAVPVSRFPSLSPSMRFPNLSPSISVISNGHQDDNDSLDEMPVLKPMVPWDNNDNGNEINKKIEHEIEFASVKSEECEDEDYTVVLLAEDSMDISDNPNPNGTPDEVDPFDGIGTD